MYLQTMSLARSSLSARRINASEELQNQIRARCIQNKLESKVKPYPSIVQLD